MKNKVLIGIIIILVGVIAFEGVYIFINWNEEEPDKSYINIPKEEEEENESNDDETSEDYVKLVDTREDDNQVIQEYEMVLNGEKQEFEIAFESAYNTESGYDFEIEAFLNNSKVYGDSGEVISANNFNIESINTIFNEHNFQFIKGEDNRNYLVLTCYYFYPSGASVNYKVLISDLSQEYSFSLINGGSSYTLENDIWYDNPIYFDREQYSFLDENGYFLLDLLNQSTEIFTKIEDDKIYTLNYEGDCTEGKLEERVYTLNNNKLEYEVINQYKILEASGAAC